MPTIPQIAHPVIIAAPASGNHIKITYTDAVEEDVDLVIPATPFFIQGDGASTDLLDAVKDALDSAASITASSVTLSPTAQKVIIAINSSKTVASLTLVQDDFKPYHLGFEVTTTATVISSFTTVASNEIATGSFRPPSTWCPSTEDFGGLRTRRDVIVSQGADDGSGVDDVYTGHRVSAHRIPEVFGVLIRSTLASEANHVANVSNLTSGDTNAALDSWLVSLHALLGGVRPTLRWTPDTSTRATYREVRINTAGLLAGVEGWIVETNDAPLFHDLEFELSEV